MEQTEIVPESKFICRELQFGKKKKKKGEKLWGVALWSFTTALFSLVLLSEIKHFRQRCISKTSAINQDLRCRSFKWLASTNCLSVRKKKIPYFHHSLNLWSWISSTKYFLSFVLCVKQNILWGSLWRQHICIQNTQ